MLLALLFVCLAAFTGASVLNFATLRDRGGNVSLQEFIEFLEAPRTLHFIYDVIDLICEQGFGTDFLVAFLSRVESQKNFTRHLEVYLVKFAKKHNRFDFLFFFAEKGMEMFSNGILLLEGAYDCQGGVVTFCFELGADPNSIYAFKYPFLFDEMIHQKRYELLYYLVEEGAEIDRPDQLGVIISCLGSNLNQDPSHVRNYEFMHSLLARTRNVEHFAVLFALGARFGNMTLLVELLEHPQVLWYLQLAKYATSILISRHKVQLKEHFGETRNGPEEVIMMQREALRLLREEFLGLVQEAEQKPATVQPLAVQDLHLMFSERTDFGLRVYVFFLQQAFDWSDFLKQLSGFRFFRNLDEIEL